MIDDSVQRRSPLMFFLLVFTLAVPFWLLGASFDIQLMPGLPITALMFVCPTIAAVILAYRERKSAGVNALLMRWFDVERIRSMIWYLPFVLLMPCVMIASYVVMRGMGISIPGQQISVLLTIGLSAVFLVEALFEELGWSGYALDPLQTRFGMKWAGVLLGLVWAAWHYVALIQAHRSMEWIAWWTLWTVSERVIMTELYNRFGRSVFTMALFHAASNVSWQLFPVRGSYFDPRVTGLITAAIAVVIATGARLTGESRLR